MRKLSALYLVPAGLVASICFDSLLSKANGQTKITKQMAGGECNLIVAANGFRLDNCLNKTKETVNDIHFSVTYREDDGSENVEFPDKNFDYVQSIGCTLSGFGDCFGPAVGPGGMWGGSGGSNDIKSNITIWANPDVDPLISNQDNIEFTGYWTIDGKKVEAEVEVENVPGPLPLLGLGVAYRFSRKLRRRLKAAGRL